MKSEMCLHVDEGGQQGGNTREKLQSCDSFQIRLRDFWPSLKKWFHKAKRASHLVVLQHTCSQIADLLLHLPLVAPFDRVEHVQNLSCFRRDKNLSRQTASAKGASERNSTTCEYKYRLKLVFSLERSCPSYQLYVR